MKRSDYAWHGAGRGGTDCTPRSEDCLGRVGAEKPLQRMMPEARESPSSKWLRQIPNQKRHGGRKRRARSPLLENLQKKTSGCADCIGHHLGTAS